MWWRMPNPLSVPTQKGAWYLCLLRNGFHVAYSLHSVFWCLFCVSLTRTQKREFPTNETFQWTAHIDIFYCVFSQTVENKTHTGISESGNKDRRTIKKKKKTWISYDPHIHDVIYLQSCIFEYCIKGVHFSSVRVCIICYMCTEKSFS